MAGRHFRPDAPLKSFMRVFFFGLGFSSLASATALRDRFGSDLPIAGTVRETDKRDLLRAWGLSAHLFERDAFLPDLLRTTHLVQSIAPGEGGDPVLTLHRDALDQAKDLEWLCYYSTVGVYGDFGGAWIDETAPLNPLNKRSQERVRAEGLWRDYAATRGLPLLILRLAGIYGPGRSPLDKLRDGTAKRIIKSGQVFNRIHVDDIGRITALAAERKLAGTFNLGDDEPAPPQDVVTYAAQRLGMTPPPEVQFEHADMTPMARSFYSDNKRVSNRAIRAALGIELLYPTYKEGLESLLP
jgi:nucleoside-diphosphate-sugar epimerase